MSGIKGNQIYTLCTNKPRYLFCVVTTILLYKLDTLLLKQHILPVLDIMGFVFTWVPMRKKKPRNIQYGPLLLFQ
jgi:hypothetical protein